jgi:hypothetical protein
VIQITLVDYQAQLLIQNCRVSWLEGPKVQTGADGIGLILRMTQQMQSPEVVARFTASEINPVSGYAD